MQNNEHKEVKSVQATPPRPVGPPHLAVYQPQTYSTHFQDCFNYKKIPFMKSQSLNQVHPTQLGGGKNNKAAGEKVKEAACLGAQSQQSPILVDQSNDVAMHSNQGVNENAGQNQENQQNEQNNCQQTEFSKEENKKEEVILISSDDEVQEVKTQKQIPAPAAAGPYMMYFPYFQQMAANYPYPPYQNFAPFSNLGSYPYATYPKVNMNLMPRCIAQSSNGAQGVQKKSRNSKKKQGKIQEKAEEKAEAGKVKVEARQEEARPKRSQQAGQRCLDLDRLEKLDKVYDDEDSRGARARQEQRQLEAMSYQMELNKYRKRHSRLSKEDGGYRRVRDDKKHERQPELSQLVSVQFFEEPKHKESKLGDGCQADLTANSGADCTLIRKYARKSLEHREFCDLLQRLQDLCVTCNDEDVASIFALAGRSVDTCRQYIHDNKEYLAQYFSRVHRARRAEAESEWADLMKEKKIKSL